MEPAATPVAIWNTALDEEIEKHAPGGEPGPDPEQAVNAGIVQAVAEAGERVAESERTPDQRLARAIADELRPIIDVEQEGSPAWFAEQAAEREEHARLVAELEDESQDEDRGIAGYYPAAMNADDTREPGWYESNGQPWYWDGAEWQAGDTVA